MSFLQYKFILDNNGALPDDYAFWDYLISTSVENWKLITYEQDWLDSQFRQMDLFKVILDRLCSAWP